MNKSNYQSAAGSSTCPVMLLILVTSFIIATSSARVGSEESLDHHELIPSTYNPEIRPNFGRFTDVVSTRVSNFEVSMLNQEIVFTQIYPLGEDQLCQFGSKIQFFIGITIKYDPSKF